MKRESTREEVKGSRKGIRPRVSRFYALIMDLARHKMEGGGAYGSGSGLSWDLGSVALTLFICERSPMVGKKARCHWQAGRENGGQSTHGSWLGGHDLRLKASISRRLELYRLPHVRTDSYIDASKTSCCRESVQVPDTDTGANRYLGSISLPFKIMTPARWKDSGSRKA